MKHMKESIMSNEIANQNIENTSKSVKNSKKAMEVIKEIENNYER